MISLGPLRIRSRLGRIGPAVALASLLVGAATLVRPSAVRAQSGDGYLFGSPPAHIDFFLGMAAPRARGALFRETMDRYTLEREDLRSVAVGGSLGLRATEQVDVALELGFARASTEVEEELHG